MTAYRELIERLEKATGPDRELDLALHNEFLPHRDGWKYRWGGQAALPGSSYCAVLDFGDISSLEERGHFEYYRDDGTATIAIPSWTASIDAAISLVEKMLPTWEWQVGKYMTEVGQAVLRAPNEDDHAGLTFAATPVLALLIALLRALEAQSKDKEGGEACAK